MKLIGLTGGIGSGKSAAAARFRERGIPVIDLDRIGHEVLAPGGAAELPVVQRFGPEVLTAGAIDRSKLGAQAFSDSAAREDLNQITHPLIRQELMRRIQRLEAEGHQIVLAEAALLAEDGTLDAWLQGLIVVTAAEETRLRRLLEQRGLQRDAALTIMHAQADPSRKLALADWVIENDGAVEQLHTQVDRIAEALHETS